MKDLISIIVPVYKVEKYLNKCVDSIINQTYKNLEIILVDDGSPDRCPQICDEYTKKDNRIKVIHKKNGGLSDARNIGIDNSTGEYIMFIDSDDYINDKMVELLYNNIKEKKSDVAICNFEYIFENCNSKKVPNITPTILNSNQFWNLYYSEQGYVVFCVVAWNKLYKKELFKTIRYDVGKYHEDEFIIHKIINQCNKISCINDKLYYYLQRENSIMFDSKLKFLKSLHSLEAFNLRTTYFINKGFNSLAQKSFSFACRHLLNVYDIKDSLNSTEQNEYNRLKEELVSLGKKISSKNSSFKFKLKKFLVLYNMDLYSKLRQLKRRKVKCS